CVDAPADFGFIKELSELAAFTVSGGRSMGPEADLGSEGREASGLCELESCPHPPTHIANANSSDTVRSFPLMPLPTLTRFLPLMRLPPLAVLFPLLHLPPLIQRSPSSRRFPRTSAARTSPESEAA